MTTSPDRTAEVVAAAAPYLESWLEHQRRRLRVPGLQAAARVGDRLVLDTALGTADVTTGETMTPAHLFRIASHSKTFTATAVLQLVEGGRLRLDDPVAQWVPALTGTGLAPVTVRELLGHQSGVVRDGADNDFWQLLHPFPDEAGLLGIATSGDARVFGRNEHFKYSNVGYSLLGLVIEAVTGTGYNAHVQAAVVDRLGLTDTGPEWDAARAGDYAAGHTGLLDGEDTRLTIPHVDTRAMAAATGFFSTARDLTRYGAAHFTGDTTLLDDASKRLMRRPESEVRAHGKARYYGLGLDLDTVGERKLIGHSGGYPGHITRTWIDPDARVVVSVLTNCVDGPADVLARGLFGLLDLALSAPDDAGRPPAEDLHRYTGRFANLWGVTDVALLGGRLVLTHPSAPEPAEEYAELTVEDPDTLRLEAMAGFGSAGETVEYEWAADGTASRVRCGGISSWPLDVFRTQRAAQVAG
jgi:D-alanyl-D-alanine carboxypeptidase